MSNTGKIDLTLLKKFVVELENSLAAAETIRAAEGNAHEYLVELSKAGGLAVSTSQEATMLLGDVQKQMMSLQNPSASKSALLEKLLGSIPGNPTGGGPLGGKYGGGFGGFGGSEN